MQQPFPLDFNSNEFRGRGAPEKKLWFEVLLDAVACYFGQVGDAAERPMLRRDAERWILIEGESFTSMSFDMVCQLLELNPRHLRSAILGGSSKRLSAAFDRTARPRKSAIVVDMEEVRRLALAGIAIPIIARRFGCSRKSIHRILRPLGLTRRRHARVGTIYAVRSGA